MRLTPTQIDELLKIIDRYTLTFIARVVGFDILSSDDKKVLKDWGIDTSKYPINNVTQAFKFGMLSQALGNSTAKLMTYDKFKQFLSNGKFISLNPTESFIIERLREQTYSDVKKLGSSIKNDVRDLFVRVLPDNSIQHTKIVTDSVKQAIEERKGLKEAVSLLGEKTGQWQRDLGRIADYSLHQAFNEGRALEIDNKQGRIYFDVYPGACKYCVKAYLTNGIGSEPKQFSYQEIVSNGTNVGKKAVDWLPTLSPTHPFCRCTVNDVPEGYSWNPVTRAFDIPLKTFERKVQRKSKVKVTINGQSTIV